MHKRLWWAAQVSGATFWKCGVTIARVNRTKRTIFAHQARILMQKCQLIDFLATCFPQILFLSHHCACEQRTRWFKIFKNPSVTSASKALVYRLDLETSWVENKKIIFCEFKLPYNKVSFFKIVGNWGNDSSFSRPCTKQQVSFLSNDPQWRRPGMWCNQILIILSLKNSTETHFWKSEKTDSYVVSFEPHLRSASG